MFDARRRLGAVADRLTILRDGREVYTGAWGKISPDEIIRYMAGRELTEIFPQRSHTAGEARLRVERLTRAGKFSDVSFAAHAGEVVGIAGLAGAGRTELVEAIFGANPADSGEIYLNGKKLRVLGIPIASSLDRAITIFASVVRTAPYGKYTARAQFDIGLAREKQGVNEAAIEAYQAVVDKFPTEPIAVDAQYQIGYIWFQAARAGTKDMAAASNAKTAFQDFLFHYPNSEKAAQARANLELLERKQTVSSFQVAKFYDKQKYYRAAVIYYNEVIRQQPGSTESDRAKKRINELRAKVGEAVLQPAFSTAEAGKKKGAANQARQAKSGSRAKPGSANNEAPLPSPGHHNCA